MILVKRFWYVGIGMGLLIMYLVMRLTNILTLPLFTDESIYVRWSQIALQDASWRFISLTDGKQPLFVWLTMTSMRIVKDPILAGRLVSVGSGILSSLGLFFLTKEVFKKTSIALLSSFLYIMYPFALVLDRMALYDGLVATFVPWSLWLAIKMVRELKSYQPFILALIIGGGVLNKSNAFFNLALLPVTLLLFKWKQKQLKQQLWKWLGYGLITFFLTELYYNMLRLSQYFYIINLKNQTFVYPVNQWIHHPFTYFLGNLHGLSDWLFTYTGILMTAVLILGLCVEKFWREKLVLLAWFAAPFFFLALFGKTIYARWELAMVISLLPIMALGIEWIGSRVMSFPQKRESTSGFQIKFVMTVRNLLICIFVYLLILSQWIYSDIKIVTDFAHAPIPQSDLNQYINDWPAGGGAKEMLTYMEAKARTQKIYVATEGTFGSVPTIILELYANGNPNIEKRGIWPTPSIIPQDLIAKAKVMPVYYVLNQTQTPPASWHVKFIAKYQKGIGTHYLHIYQVLP